MSYNAAKRAQMLIALCETILEAVGECPDGAPSGSVYAALMGFGLSLESYQMLINTLVAAKKIRVANNLLFAVH
jgi:hypothetical protein